MAGGAPSAQAGPRSPPGAPGARSDWLNADKDGFGTAAAVSSKLWYTLERGSLTEVDYPRLDVPDVRSLQIVVSDGRHAVPQRSPRVEHHLVLADPRALEYRQTSTLPGRWRLTETFATDPARPTLLIAVRFTALDESSYRLSAVYDPSLRNSPTGDSGRVAGAALLAHDGPIASALLSSRPFVRASTGAGPGNIVQTAQVGRAAVRSAGFTLALAFGSRERRALAAARADLGRWRRVSSAYAAGWHSYVAGLRPVPESASTGLLRDEYLVSLMVLRASEDRRSAARSSPRRRSRGDGSRPS